MEMQYFKEYSPALGREMECKIYGHGGRPMLYIPCQDGRFFDFEDFHMADTLAPWIESGQIMVLSIDTLDKETWSDTNGDPYWRIRRYEQWLRYIVDEAVPKLRYLSKERNGWDDLPGVIAFGCSLGATHAVNLYLRRPDIFCGCLALSGIYTAHYGFGDYMDELAYRNSPVDYMRIFVLMSEFFQYFFHYFFIFQYKVVWIFLLFMSFLLRQEIAFKCRHLILSKQRRIFTQPDIPHDIFSTFFFFRIHSIESFSHVTFKYFIKPFALIRPAKDPYTFQITVLFKRYAAMIKKIAVIYFI